MTTGRLAEQVAQFPFWYHRIALPDGTVTPGAAPISAAAYRLPEDLTGKRVLDVGAWDGYWSFEALKRGAREVVAIDDFSDYLGHLDRRDRQAWATFDFCRNALGYSAERCQRIEMSVYDVTPERLGHFDYVFFFGTLYHLRHPFFGLERLAAVTDDVMIVESAILDDFSAYRGGLNHGYPGPQLVMEFYPTNQYGENDSNWWVPSLYCLMAMMNAVGFPDVKGWKLMQTPTQVAECRGFARGQKLAAATAPKI